MHPNFLLHGRSSPPAPPIALQAGPVTALFDSDSGFLRRIRIAGTETIRGIYGAVRNHNWDTISPWLHHLKVDQRDNAFSVNFEARCRRDSIDFSWHGTITGSPDGTMTYRFSGEAHSRFLRNRIGLCLLHPLQGCAGQACCIEATDGAITHTSFPELISPLQPFFNVKAIRHNVFPGVEVEVRFEGDVFETEDQRNWSDASFKTYGTPLEKAFPVEIKPGERVEQQITLRLLTEAPCLSPLPETTPVTVALSPTSPLARPSLGFCLPESDMIPSARQQHWLRALHPDHLRAEIRFAKSNWQDRLRLAARQATLVGTTLHLALHLTDTPETDLAQLGALIPSLRLQPSLLLVFQTGRSCTPRPLLETTEAWAQRFAPVAQIAAGTNAFFTELNRERPAPDSPALPCFSLNPQVHAFDERSLIENIEAQSHVVDSAYAFAGRNVIISPITLRMRWNPSTTVPSAPTQPGDLPPDADPRQLSLFGAAWTLASLAALLPHPRVHALTYYETVGSRGLMESESGSVAPECFPSLPGTPFPLFYPFYGLAGTRPHPSPEISHPERVAALQVTTSSDTPRLLLANLTPQPQSVSLHNFTGTPTITTVDESNAANLTPAQYANHSQPAGPSPHSATHTLTLPPYAYVRVDSAALSE